MAPHSSTLAWKVPWMEEPGRLQSMGSLRVRHDWVTSLSLFTFMHWRRKWQPTPVFLPGESQGRGILVGCHLWGCTDSDTTEVTQQQQQQQSAQIVNIRGADLSSEIQKIPKVRNRKIYAEVLWAILQPTKGSKPSHHANIRPSKQFYLQEGDKATFLVEAQREGQEISQALVPFYSFQFQPTFL